MALQLFTNEASATLSVGILAGDTSLTVSSGGSLFPAPTGGDWMVLTLEDTSGNIEYVKCTARAGNVFSSLTRAQEGSTALAFAAGSRVEIRPTAGTMENLFQRSDPTLDADLDANNFSITNIDGMDANSADITIVRTTAVRSTDNNASNQLAVPTGGGAATAGGSVILTASNAPTQLPITAKFPVGGVIMWSGSIGTIPAGWGLCDGTLYGSVQSPDLRGLFIIGAGGSYAVGATGGAHSNTTAAGSGTVTVDPHTLTVDELPSHGHPFRVSSQTATTAQSDTDGGLMMNADANANQVAYAGTPSSTIGQQIGGTGGGQGHSHTATAGSHTHTVTSTPPYYALAFIIKLAY